MPAVAAGTFVNEHTLAAIPDIVGLNRDWPTPQRGNPANMNTSSENATSSCWRRGTESSVRSPLTATAAADVCIVGAGIAGLTTAYLLAREGARVVVLDDGPIGGGETGRSTAHLASALDDRWFEIERLHGREASRLAAQSHMAAIDAIERIVAAESIDCGFTRLDGYLFGPPEGAEDILEREEAAALRAGHDVRFVPQAPIEGFDTGPCLCFANQGQFHPLRYLHALAAAIEARGGRIHTGSHVAKVSGGATPKAIASNGAEVAAGAVVVATNTPINDRVTMHTKQAAYRTFVVGLRMPRSAAVQALYWDTLDPYHYVRVAGPTDEESDLLIVGGEDHKTGQADDGAMRFTRLEAWARERFPMAQQTLHRWSGQILEPIDGLAYIGRNPGDEDNIYIATGDSGNGITHGTIAGLLLCDLIRGRANPWQALYDPARISPQAAADFARENLNVVRQYSAWVRRGEVRSEADIVAGRGAIVRDGLRKIAVYRDEDGALHRLDATCPHLGCLVAWNSTERTWDCPCHGSRFAPDGHALNGPANVGLAVAELETETS